MSELQTTGKLEKGYSGHYKCVDCETQYLAASENIEGIAKCNGHIIMLCPWCRPDSVAWKDGRGM